MPIPSSPPAPARNRGTLRPRAVVVAVLLLAMAVAPSLAPAPASAATAVLLPVADATVDQASPTRNYGTRTTLLVDGDHGSGNDRWAYLRFALGSSTAPITRAVLRLWVIDPTSSRPTVQASPNTWTESAVTWASRPLPSGPATPGGGSVAAGAWLEVDVRAQLPTSGDASLAVLPTSASGIDFSSREGATSPQLVIERGSQATASPSASTRPSTAPSPTTVPSPTAVPSPSVAPTSSPSAPGNLTLPLRGAFYYPWFPETWTVNGAPARYTPDLGRYSSDSAAVVARHVQALDHGKVDVAITSWWGRDTHKESTRIPLLLNAAAAGQVRVGFYYEKEGFGNPTTTQIASDITYLLQQYGSHPGAARIGGRLVVFVYNADDADCSVADRWRAANAGRVYLSLKVFTGYRNCAAQPDAWHQYGPATATSRHTGHSYAISPGFWLANEANPRLARDISAWTSQVAAMVASGEPWQLVTTFNEWGEGTAVEGAAEWATTSGFGAYLDALHTDGVPGGAQPTPTPTSTPTPTPTATPTATASPPGVLGTVAVSGDIACDPGSASFNGGLGSGQSCRQLATSDLLADAGLVLTTGDNQYEDGTLAKYQQSYHLSWGRYLSKTRPVPGNHEYNIPGATGYYDYFGARAGDRTKGYYSFDYAGWHFVALNSNCSAIGGCGASSPQVAWLKADLAASSARCTIAFWHHPRWSAAQYGDNASVSVFWDVLYAYGAELVLNGHDHNYQRYAPMTPAGVRDDARGIREIVAGMGGKNHYQVDAGPIPNREAADATSHGVLSLKLRDGSYDWEFLPAAGGTYRDSGTATCH